MSEKLYRAKCRVHGGGWCEVAQEQHPDKRGLRRIRRRKGKQTIRAELEGLWERIGSETETEKAMGIHKKVINIDKNCHRLLDAADLFDVAYETCKELHDDGVRDKNISMPYRQPYIVNDVVVDIFAGQMVIYYHDND